uniref:Uncharacterized protein n=1 Tax=Leersia perrieri TaxID=77586 RepID=A0A0D9WT60_9ORYZ
MLCSYCSAKVLSSGAQAEHPPFFVSGRRTLDDTLPLSCSVDRVFLLPREAIEVGMGGIAQEGES